MGASGGITGIRLAAPPEEREHALETLHRIMPEEFFGWIESDPDNYYREPEYHPDFIYSTFGSFQDWDLGDLRELVEACEEYHHDHPTATFLDWAMDLYVNFTPGWFGWLGTEMGKYVAERYLGCRFGMRGYPQTFTEPSTISNDEFGPFNVGMWARVVKEILMLETTTRDYLWT